MQTSWITSVFLLPALVQASAGLGKDFSIVKRDGGRPSTQTAPLFGPSHGKDFDDGDIMSRLNAKITSIDFTGCGKDQHLNSITFWVDAEVVYRDGHDTKRTGVYVSEHGKKGGKQSTLKLKAEEYITEITVTTWQTKTGFFHQSKRTRIGSITLKNNKGTVFTCGSRSDTDPQKVWSFTGYKFSYFYGSKGDAIDALGAVFSAI